MRTNEPEAFSRRSLPRYGTDDVPSWAGAPPPPTEPALPPIRGAHPPDSAALPTRNGSATRPSRALIPTSTDAHRAVQAGSAPGERGIAPLADAEKPGATAGAPMIIPGDGKPSALRPIAQRQYPRSRATHIAIIAVAACLILAALFAVSPLTAGATGNTGNFLASANVWSVPTALPTATPVPHPPSTSGNGSGGGNGAGYNPGQIAIMDDIRAVFGPAYAQGALNIARCESGYDPNAWNGIAILGSHASGVFQILYPITWNGTSERAHSPYEYHPNILAAHEIFVRDGNSWREWACHS